MKFASYSNTLWALGYGLLLAAVVMSLQRTRDWARREYSTDSAQEDWAQWRAEAERQAQGAGPVKRRVPKSQQPPILVLMSDYYRTCLVAGVIFSSAIFFTLMFMLRGTLGKPAVAIRDDPDSEHRENARGRPT